MIRSTLLILDRQKKLEGDLNIIQQTAVAWLIGNDIEKQIDLEKLRAVNTGLATNPATAKEFITSLLDDDRKIEETVTDEKWTTPKSVQEIEEFLRLNS